MSLDRFRPQKRPPDFVYIGLAVALAGFGLVMVSSSSVVVAIETYNQTYGFVIRQLVALAIGAIGAIWVSRISDEVFRRFAVIAYVISLGLVISLFIPGIGKEVKGAVRWIDFGWFQFQPAEALKFSAIFYFAAWLYRRRGEIKRIETFLAFLALLVPIVVVMMLQRDLGTLLVILATCGLLYFMSGAHAAHVVTGLGVAVAVVVLLIAIEPYRLERLKSYRQQGENVLTTGYHINQASLAVGSGGWLGRGFGQSVQKYLYLPEPQTDSIFAITVEELGFARSTLVILLIAALAYRGYVIASCAGDLFARLLAFGITAMFVVQSAINIGAILGLIPLTGIPLPFISYGGSSLVFSLIAVGVMASLSRHRYVRG